MAKKKDVDVPEMAFVFPDLRVADGEELHFEFEALAKTLAELARNPANQTPFTVVVKGDWGRGKTTLLRRAKWLLEEGAPAGARKVETLWLNAWKYPKEESVLAGLLGALIDRLQKGDLWEQLKVGIDERKHGLAKAVLRQAAPGLFGALDGEGRYSESLSKRAFYDTFQSLFAQVSYLLFNGASALRDTQNVPVDSLWTPAEQGKNVLAVFLDDLDRCRHDRVLEVLEAINLFLDQPGVCFFLGLSWDRLHEILPEAVRGHGEEFMEKILQVALELPTVTEEGAAEYLAHLRRGSSLGELLSAEDAEAMGHVLEQRHPRHLKRFLNDLSIGLAVLRNAGKLQGEGEEDSPKVPPRAVVAWHLLAEVLPAEEWRGLRARAENLDGFLRRWQALGEIDEAEEEKGKAGGREAKGAGFERLAVLYAGRRLDPYVRALADLSREQRGILVHLATPAEGEAPKTHPARRVALDLLDKDGEAWVHLRGGSFTMGSEVHEREAPIHPVRLSPFLISRYPVTNAQYAAFVRDTGKEAPGHWRDGAPPEGKERHPVTQVSWADATAFCTWLAGKAGLGNEKDKVLGLPREAEWEFAARGEEGRTYPWGEAPPSAELANFGSEVGDTTAVDAYPAGATPDGVWDLGGNVLEWCRDWYGDYPDAKEELKDPAGLKEGTSRVLRGGSFVLASRSLRSAFRSYRVPRVRDGHVGFRVVWRLPRGLD